MSMKEFEGKGPAFIPEDYLSGDLAGWGVLESPLGALKSRYTIIASGLRVGGGVDFTETWTFDNGRVETLRWKIRKSESGKYIGTEPKVDGEAQGEVAGFAFHWNYTRLTPQQDGEAVTLNFDDWFYLIDERVCIVRGSAGRLGLPFAIAHVTYRKE
jgi:hypothetical protein